MAPSGSKGAIQGPPQIAAVAHCVTRRRRHGSNLARQATRQGLGRRVEERRASAGGLPHPPVLDIARKERPQGEPAKGEHRTVVGEQVVRDGRVAPGRFEIALLQCQPGQRRQPVGAIHGLAQPTGQQRRALRDGSRFRRSVLPAQEKPQIRERAQLDQGVADLACLDKGSPQLGL